MKQPLRHTLLTDKQIGRVIECFKKPAGKPWWEILATVVLPLVSITFTSLVALASLWDNHAKTALEIEQARANLVSITVVPDVKELPTGEYHIQIHAVCSNQGTIPIVATSRKLSVWPGLGSTKIPEGETVVPLNQPEEVGPIYWGKRLIDRDLGSALCSPRVDTTDEKAWTISTRSCDMLFIKFTVEMSDGVVRSAYKFVPMQNK